MKKRISIVDVARLANTSTTTVSRIINDTGYPVSEDVRKRVIKAVEDLKFTPSISAQQLRQDFSQMIGLIARDIAAEFFGEIAKGATERAMELGCLSFICNTGREASNEFKFHELLWRNRVRGVVLIGGGYDTEEYRLMMHRQLERANHFGFRIVTNTPQGFDMPSVTIDHKEAFNRLTEYLISKNHRTIALITADKQVYTSREHRDGFEEALRNHNLPIFDGLIRFHSFTEQGGYISCKEIMQQIPRPTAICCGCDPVALGALRAINELGLSVPQDISIVSFGNTSVATHLYPALTSIDVPRYRMGAMAVEMILTDLYEKETNIILPTKLIERESVRYLEDPCPL